MVYEESTPRKKQFLIQNWDGERIRRRVNRYAKTLGDFNSFPSSSQDKWWWKSSLEAYETSPHALPE